MKFLFSCYFVSISLSRCFVHSLEEQCFPHCLHREERFNSASALTRPRRWWQQTTEIAPGELGTCASLSHRFRLQKEASLEMVADIRTQRGSSTGGQVERIFSAMMQQGKMRLPQLVGFFLHPKDSLRAKWRRPSNMVCNVSPVNIYRESS